MARQFPPGGPIFSIKASNCWKQTSMSQKLRRVFLLVGVVDSGVLVPVTGEPPTWVMLMGEGLLPKTLGPLHCRGLAFTSFISDEQITCPTRTHAHAHTNIA